MRASSRVAENAAMAQHRIEVAVVGAGAVGSFFGAMLARAGHDVVLIGRAGARRSDPPRWPASRDGRPERHGGARREQRDRARRAAPISSSSASSRPTPTRSRATSPPSSTTARSSSACRTASRTQRRSRATSLRRSFPRSSTSRRRCPSPGVVRHHGRGDLVVGPLDRRRRRRRRARENGSRRSSRSSAAPACRSGSRPT